MEKLLAPIRSAVYHPAIEVGASDEYPGVGGNPSRALLLKDARDNRSLVFVFGADPTTDALMADVIRRNPNE
jgi:hypothetical protein